MDEQQRIETIDALMGLVPVLDELVGKGVTNGLVGVYYHTQLERAHRKADGWLRAMQAGALVRLEGLMPSNIHEPAITTGLYPLSSNLLDTGMRGYIESPYTRDDAQALNDAIYAFQIASRRFDVESLKTEERITRIRKWLGDVPTFQTLTAQNAHKSACQISKVDVDGINYVIEPLKYVPGTNYLVYMLSMFAARPDGPMHEIVRNDRLWRIL